MSRPGHTLGYSFSGESSLSLSFFPLSGYPTVWLATPCWLTHIVLMALRPGPYPKHATHASLCSPCSLVADASIWATSPLGVAVRCIVCFLFLFFLSVMLPSKILKLPTDPPVRGFPAIWKLILLHNSLPRRGLPA